jgi:plasmid stabilization system protein ParE
VPNVNVLPEAVDDVRAEAAYYDDRGSPRTAVRWIKAAYQTFDEIAAGRRTGELRLSARREYRRVRVATVIDFPRQVVVYREIPGAIEILRVPGGRQDLDRLLGPRRS